MYDQKELSKNVLATISYYDVFSYPLTAFEIWKYLMRSDYFEEGKPQGASIIQILHELKKDPLSRFVEEDKGFYFLKGRSGLVPERIRKAKLSFVKARRLKKIVAIIRFVPFVRMVGVTGRLAMKNARVRSDWDLLIVLKDGRIWIGRTLVTVMVHLLGKRRYGNRIKDRVCLNYFISDKHLEIFTKDLYSASEYFFMYPLFGFDVFRRFQLKNGWISSIKPNFMPTEVEPNGIISESRLSQIVRSFGEILFGWEWLERFLGRIERDKIMRNPKTRQKGGLIQASDEALVFLPELKGPKIFDEFKKRIENLH